MCKSVWDEETWPYIILNYDRLIFKEFNNGTKLLTSYSCHPFFLYCPIFCLDRPFGFSI